ncbi:iron-containing alcohol dehydrogenase [Trametes maxima]|nr:iron-containing alcohol dehydrogenase [Trametes maxima]
MPASTPHDQSSSMQTSYSWNDTIRGVYYGPGCVKTALPNLLEQLGGKRALIVTGRSLYDKARRSNLNVLEDTLSTHYAQTDVVKRHAPVANIRAGLQRFKDAGADISVSVGGGSPIDEAKMIFYLYHEESGGPFLKQIAIPTTLSAAEYTSTAGFTTEDGHKTLVSIPPAGIILDSELTISTPERLWFSSGMCAIDHAVETLYRPFVPPPVKHLAYAAIVDFFEYLLISKTNPHSIEVRQKLQMASWMSLWPTKLEKKSPFGLSDSLGHNLGAKYNIPHGITTCITLPSVVALEAQSLSREDQERLAGVLFKFYLGKPSTGVLKGNILALSAEIQRYLDRRAWASFDAAAEYDVPKSDISKVAEKSVEDCPVDKPLLPKVVEMLESVYA